MERGSTRRVLWGSAYRVRLLKGRHGVIIGARYSDTNNQSQYRYAVCLWGTRVSIAILVYRKYLIGNRIGLPANQAASRLPPLQAASARGPTAGGPSEGESL
jgi:hypothetical protein